MGDVTGVVAALVLLAAVVIAFRRRLRHRRGPAPLPAVSPLLSRTHASVAGRTRQLDLSTARPSLRPPEPRLNAPVTLVGAHYNAVFHGTSSDGRLVVRAATLRGHAHNHENLPGQDVVGTTWNAQRGSVFAAVADGIGSRPDSGAAAHHLVIQVIERATCLGPHDDPRQVIDRSAAATRHYLGLEELDGASTLLVAEVSCGPTAARASVWGIGDSEAWFLIDGHWSPLHQELSPAGDSATRCIPDHQDAHVNAITVPGTAVLVLATDGFARALGGHNSPLAKRLVDAWREPPGPTDFMAQVDFTHPYFNDDRSVVAVWIR